MDDDPKGVRLKLRVIDRARENLMVAGERLRIAAGEHLEADGSSNPERAALELSCKMWDEAEALLETIALVKHH